MLIGIDASRANKQYKGGVEWYSYHLIRELAKIDANNQYVLYTDKPLTNGLADLTSNQTEFQKTEICIDKKNWQKIKSPYNNFRCKIIKHFLPFFWTQIALSLEMLFHPPDILFIPAHTLPIIHPRKSVVTLHDIGFIRKHRLYSRERINSVSKFWHSLLNLLTKIVTLGKYEANIYDYYKWSTKFTLKHAQKIITVSRFSQSEIIKFYSTKPKDIKVIYHGYDNKLYQKINNLEEINKVLNQYGIEGPYIFYIGRLEKKKNISTLIEAYAIMREQYPKIKHKLVLVGCASYSFDEIKNVIQEFNIDNEIILTGWMPEKDIPFIYNGATALIFPSYYEGFGIPLLQAMACGTPIAASNVASIPEVVQDSALLFNPFDKNKMAKAIAKIIIDNNLRQDLIKKGYFRINHFSHKKNAQETLAVLESL
ncbi:MAG: glycosyltransferase family 1 protein [Patescibacteria group bacterium]|nr:glycosyltransferase family 4 protein [Patescibacteria group bacterium]MBU1870554.1 glycosyltransferase family 4 protein [Patescibacteria group bacterium]